MPKLITLVEDEYNKLLGLVHNLVTDAEHLVGGLHKNGFHPDANPGAVAASVSAVKAHVSDPNMLLAVPDLTPKPMEVHVVAAMPAHAPAASIPVGTTVAVSTPNSAAAPVAASTAGAPVGV